MATNTSKHPEYVLAVKNMTMLDLTDDWPAQSHKERTDAVLNLLLEGGRRPTGLMATILADDLLLLRNKNKNAEGLRAVIRAKSWSAVPMRNFAGALVDLIDAGIRDMAAGREPEMKSVSAERPEGRPVAVARLEML